MYIFLSILILLASLLLIGVVLIQKSKGGGLASNFSGANQVMGVRKSTDFIEKATWSLAIFIAVCSIVSAFFIPNTLVQGSRIVQQPVQQEQSTPFATEKAVPAQTTVPTTETPATPAE